MPNPNPDATPIIVGVADVVNRSLKIEDAIEPLELMRAAVGKALDDLHATDREKVLKAVNNLSIVRTWTWEYDDLPSLLASKLNIRPQHRIYSQHGGHSPAKLIDEAARKISKGESSMAIITGGEALASLTACARAKQMPPRGWTKPASSITGGVFSPTTRALPDDIGGRHGIGNPIHIYPLYENALRASRGQTQQENHEESAELYARFAKVAATHPYAWNYGQKAASAESIADTDPKRNRLICHPYPLVMNAFNTVNLAAAVILTSVAKAQELGIPEDRWVYVLGGAGTNEPSIFWDRRQFDECDAVKHSLLEALKVSNLRKEDLDLVDFYSCFPIVPKLAARYLNLPILPASPPDAYKELTILGGLTSFGGAGNNYSLHAFSEMTRKIRAADSKSSEKSAMNGLVLANGGVLSYQHVVCLSNKPRSDGSPYPATNPLPEIVGTDSTPKIVEVVEKGGDSAIIETYTVEYDRSGAPSRAFVVGRLNSTGARFVANHKNGSTLRQLASREYEIIGQEGYVESVDGKSNLFSFGPTNRL